MIERIPVLLKLPWSHCLFAEADDLISSSLRARNISFLFALPKLNEQDLHGIYPHLPAVILNAQIAQFAHKEIGLWMVEGEDVIEIVTQNKGSNNDPDLCDPRSWRSCLARLIGRRSIGLIDADGAVVTVFDNYVHVPKRDEVARDMAVLRRFV